MNIDFLGYAAGFIIAIALFPQIWKSWTTRSVQDISYQWTFLHLTGVLLWIFYGIALRLKPILIFASMEAILIASLVFLKFFLEKE